MALTKVSYSMITGSPVNVLDYGALGDGTSNDTVAIQAANNAAAAAGRSLYFPKGIYQADPLTATTSWLGEPGATIRYRGTGNVFLVSASNTPKILIQNLIFDGNVSADPGNWSTGYNSFTGAIGLSVSNCDGARIIDCYSQNNWQSGFRLSQCDGAVISGCSANKNRGNFGDCFFLNSCTNLRVINCRAYDFTRIGFVCDTSDDQRTSYNIQVQNCSAEYGHDASINYGGVEYNSGLWFENTAHVEIDGFISKNTGNRGVNLCTGLKNNGVQGDVSFFSVNNTQVFNADYGIIMYSLGSFPFAGVVNNAQVYDVTVGIKAIFAIPNESFSCSNSYVELSMNKTQSRAFSWICSDGLTYTTRPVYRISNCTIRHITEAAGYLTGYGVTTSCADIGCWTANNYRLGIDLRVDNVQNVDKTKPIWFGIPVEQTTSLSVTNVKVAGANNPFLGQSNISFENCELTTPCNFGEAATGTTAVNNCLITGQTKIGGANVMFSNNQIIIADTSYVELFTSATNKKPGIIIQGCYFQKNINANNRVLWLQFDVSTDTVIIMNSVFYNSGSASATNTFIWYALNQTQIFVNCLVDNTVTNVMQLPDNTGTIALPAGCTATTFH